MESDDPKVIEFLDIVFQDMRHTVAGAVNLSSSLRDQARPYAKFRKLLNVMYRALDPMHMCLLETLFKNLPLNRPNAFHVMSSHCIAVWEQCTEGIDVFLHLMYTCSFTYSLLSFCESNGEPNLLCRFSEWILEVFPVLIKPKFEDADGWEGLYFFCSTSNLHFILDFINLCYNKQGKLFTHIVLGETYFFGLNHDDIITFLKTNFKDFKNSVLTEYESELNSNFRYKFAVMLAFIKIELAFDHTASVFNPPSPRKRLLYQTPVLFKYYIWDSLKNDIPENIRRAFVEQEEQARVNMQAYLNQEQSLTDQEKILTGQDLTNQKQTDEQVGDDYFNSEQAPSLDFLITTLQEYIRNKYQTPSIDEDFLNDIASPGIKENALDIVEQALNKRKQELDNKEQNPDINEKGLKTIEEISTTVKQYFANAKKFNTVEKEIAIAEQTFSAMKLAPDIKQAPDNANASHFESRTIRRLAFVKHDPDDESSSDSE